MAEAQREAYWRNPKVGREKARLRVAASYARNPKPFIARAAAYNRKHPEKLNEYVRRWAKKNPEKILANTRRWAEANRDHLRALQREWARKHPDASRVKCHRRRAVKLQAVGTHSRADITSQYEKQNGLCYWCSKPLHRKYHVDHVIPLSRGGSNWPDNIVCSCAVCNLKKGAKLPSEFKKAA